MEKMKKMLLKSTVTLALGLSFVACGGVDKSSDYDDLIPDRSGGTSIDRALKVSKSSNSIKLQWSRTGKVRNGSYTQLEVRNSSGTYVLATTNTNSKITISCRQDYKQDNDIKYTCSPSNYSLSQSFWFKGDEKNIVQERGGVNRSNRTLKIGSL